MEWKIGDLTLRQLKELCDFEFNKTWCCNDCPLFKVCQNAFGSNTYDLLDEEIEISNMHEISEELQNSLIKKLYENSISKKFER